MPETGPAAGSSDCLPPVFVLPPIIKSSDMPNRVTVRAGVLILYVFLIVPVAARDNHYRPVTRTMLENPDPGDWLMLSRTYDEQRYSPLDEINTKNVGQLQLVWARGIPQGTQQTIPIVHDGIMYVVIPPAGVEALDAANGDLIWKYNRNIDPHVNMGLVLSTSAKSLAIYEDMVYYTPPDGYLVALDARDGKVRWETEMTPPYQHHTGGKNTSAPIVVEGNVITGRGCSDQKNCFIAAYDATSGKEVWRFYTAAAEGQPGGDTWGDEPSDERTASVWGLPGSYDPGNGLLYWGVANPRPVTRMKRHGSADGTARTAPADLYTNSTIALNAKTGKLAWYYQHLPGDDWDSDFAHERILVHTAINPDPQAVKWINPAIKAGGQRDIVLAAGEPGGIWALDRNSGEFLWASPFPADTPDFILSGINVRTGRTRINWDRVLKRDGDKSLVCFYNTRSYWPTAYDPDTNDWYIPFHDYCLRMTADSKDPNGSRDRKGIIRPGVASDKSSGLARVNVSTGKITRIYESGVPDNGAVLATAGGLLFWGDMNRRFRAFAADSGRILWKTILGGVIQTSTITYAVDGRQYITVMTGDGNAATRNPIRISGITPPRGHNEIYTFALGSSH